MIYPDKIVRDDYTDKQLEELLIFCIAVAGKNARTTARNVDAMLNQQRKFFRSESPLEVIEQTWMNGGESRLQLVLKNAGIGQQTRIARALKAVVDAEWRYSLRTVCIADLEAIPGIGPKTSRFFLSCFRPGLQVAILDTHVLKFLKANGVERVPKSTPSGSNYLRLEQEFLKLVPKPFTPAEFDLIIWNRYAPPQKGDRTIIHVNQHVIKANRKHGTIDPVLTVKGRGGRGKALYGHEVAGDGFKVIYRPERPLSCGAHVWIETERPVAIRVFEPPTCAVEDCDEPLYADGMCRSCCELWTAQLEERDEHELV